MGKGSIFAALSRKNEGCPVAERGCGECEMKRCESYLKMSDLSKDENFFKKVAKIFGG